MDTSSNANKSIEQFNYVILPSTQQQIEMLPAEETSDLNDPLNSNNTEFNLSISSTTGRLTLSQPIKSEQIEKKLLTNILFCEDDNGNIQYIPYKDEIVNLDDSTESAVIDENLPPSQINFDESQQYLLSDILVNDDNINSLLILAQHIPSSAESNDATQQTIQQSQNVVTTATQSLKLPDVGLKSSGENKSCENVQPPDQRFTSYIVDTQTLMGSASAERLNNTLQQEQKVRIKNEDEVVNTSCVMFKEKQPTYVVAIPINSSSLLSAGSQSSTNIPRTTLPLQQRIPKTYMNTNKKYVAKVKPLITNSDIVPQIQHNTRPLRTIPYRAASNSNNNQELDLEPSTSSNSCPRLQQTTQNSSLQLRLSPTSTHIYVSQELNKNCSIFDNSSLLRIVDNNYFKKDTTNLSSAAIETPEKSNIIQEPQQQQRQQRAIISNTKQQPKRIIIGPNTNNLKNCGTEAVLNVNTVSNKAEVCTKQNAQTSTLPPNAIDNTHQQSARIVTLTSSCLDSTQQSNDPKQPTSRRIVNLRTSNLSKENNDKVNNFALTHTNNLVATIAPTIHQPFPDHKMLRKFCLHREILKFHYFKELTAQHIGKYLLPSLEIGKSYTEAWVVSENFRTRVANRSISVLFPFWPQNLQRDFLMVLDDLREFHYVVYERVSMQKQEDLRARILFWLLHTAPSFALCQFVYEANNTEFSRCEAITNANNPSYERKPFKCLANALSPNVLSKLKETKLSLKKI